MMRGKVKDMHLCRPLARLSRRRILQAAGALGPLMVLAPQMLHAQGGGKPLKVGAMGPYTGPASRAGSAIKQGIMMALEDARANGEVPVIVDGKARDIEIVWVDSQSSPEAAVKAVIDAVMRQGVEFMISGWHSSVAMAVMDAEAPFKIVHLGHLGESQYIAEKIDRDPKKYQGWFKSWPSSPKLTGLYAEPLQYFQERGLWRPANNRAAVMVEDTDFGRGWGEALLAGLKQAGFDPLPYDVTAVNETEFTPLLSKYKAQQVSLVAMTSTGNIGASNFVKQFRSQGVKALLLGHGLRHISGWYELTGNASDYVIAMDSPMPIALWQHLWVNRFKSKYNEEPHIAAAGLQYDYTRMAIKALNEAGTLDFDALTRLISEAIYKGVWNRYRFSIGPGPHALSANEVMTGRFMEGFFFPMAQLLQGKAKIIWPLPYADQAFRQPPWL